MHWLWTWGGLSFGYRDGDNLWTYDGEHVGRFEGDVVYDRAGRYLGEVRRGNRLIVDRARKTMTSGSMPFEPAPPRASQARHVNSRPIAMLLGYEDFPTRERLGANSG